jgi:hypothetical protein
MTEKLKRQGDISAEEATRIFLLAVVMYAYEMGDLEDQYMNSFGGKFNYEMSEALVEWYKEVSFRIPDVPEFRNFITSIPSREICPLTLFKIPAKNKVHRMINAMDKMMGNKRYVLEENPKTSDSFYLCANEKMIEWIKNNVPLSFDVTCHYKSDGIGIDGASFARFGVLGLLPTYEREIKKEKIQTLLKLDIPFLRETTDNYLVICPAEYKDVLDAVADDLPIPEMPQKTSSRVPKDIAYINSLVSRVSDITEEEADDLYLLFKTYQALRTAALKSNKRYRKQVKNAAEPGLEALCSWYKAVEKELKKGKRGDFVYTLPSDLNMNLYQLRKPIEKCLKMLPKEPSIIMARDKEDFPVKEVFLDTRSSFVRPAYCQSFLCKSSRYGFFQRNGINWKAWKPVLEFSSRFDENTGNRMLNLNNSYKDPTSGKLLFAEKLGIKYIVMDHTIAVKNEDRPKMLEILNLSDEKIMETAELIKPKTESSLSEFWESDYMVKSVEMVYRAQKDKKEYIESGEWMEMDR